MELTQKELIMIHDALTIEEEMSGSEPEEYPEGTHETYRNLRLKIKKYIDKTDQRVVWSQQ